MLTKTKTKGKRGFAGMDPALQKSIASKGGKAAQAKGTGHRYTSETARAAGKLGGKAAHKKGSAHTFTSQTAKLAGAKGNRKRQKV